MGRIRLGELREHPIDLCSLAMFFRPFTIGYRGRHYFQSLLEDMIATFTHLANLNNLNNVIILKREIFIPACIYIYTPITYIVICIYLVYIYIYIIVIIILLLLLYYYYYYYYIFYILIIYTCTYNVCVTYELGRASRNGS